MILSTDTETPLGYRTVSNVVLECDICNTKEGYLIQAVKDNRLCSLCLKCMIRDQFQTETKQAIMDILVDDKEYKDIYFDFNTKEKQPS